MIYGVHMRRLIIVYNPDSSQYSRVKEDILNKLKNLKGYIIGKYKVDKTDVDQNATKLSKLLKNGDFVISAGGDATGIIASNAILKSGKDVSLAVLPYGNFNDLSRTLGAKTLEDVMTAGPAQKLYPLEIYVDGKFFRYATCYVTIGMMGEAVKLYDTKKMRKKLKTNFGRKIISYTALAGWYFKNRHKKIFLPEFKLNGKLQSKKVSDYYAISGKYMARVMRNNEDYKKPKTFRSNAARLTSLCRFFSLMAKSILYRVPGSETKGDKLEFLEPATVELQAEGEYKVFKNIRTIEVRKGKKCLKVITKR